LAADDLPELWVADEDTQARRRQVARRAHLVRQRTRLKNQVQAILHRTLVARCPAADRFGIKGRGWLAEQELPADERRAVVALLRQLDFHGHELRLIDAELERIALGCQDTQRLMTISGVDVTVAMSITAAVGTFFRFDSPNKPVGDLGRNPRVKQSGEQPAAHGRIATQGRAHARGMLVEAAWVAVKPPGPLSACFRARARAARDADRRCGDRAQARRAVPAPDHPRPGLRLRAPSLTAKKLRALEREAGMPARRDQTGPAAAYSAARCAARCRRGVVSASASAAGARSRRDRVDGGRPGCGVSSPGGRTGGERTTVLRPDRTRAASSRCKAGLSRPPRARRRGGRPRTG
jgi:transposase